MKKQAAQVTSTDVLTKLIGDIDSYLKRHQSGFWYPASYFTAHHQPASVQKQHAATQMLDALKSPALREWAAKEDMIESEVQATVPSQELPKKELRKIMRVCNEYVDITNDAFPPREDKAVKYTVYATGACVKKKYPYVNGQLLKLLQRTMQFVKGKYKLCGKNENFDDVAAEVVVAAAEKKAAAQSAGPNATELQELSNGAPAAVVTRV